MDSCGDAATRYLINEIVTGEESDIDPSGNRVSHFELYISAMKQADCNLTSINKFIQGIANRVNVQVALQDANVGRTIFDFVSNTFETINSNKPHVAAAVFTFGREDLIPGMFVSFVRDLNTQAADKASVFQYYLERHIEVDGDHHSLLALEMTHHLCGNNVAYWGEATAAVIKSLEARLKLWDGISAQLQ